MVLGLPEKLKIAGWVKATSEFLIYLDKSIGKMEDQAKLPRDATNENPQLEITTSGEVTKPLPG